MILKLKRAIDKKFAHLSKEKRFYIFNRIIGARHYHDIKWDGTAGEWRYFVKNSLINVDLSEIERQKLQYTLEDVFKQLGLSKKEYSQLMYELNNQHGFSAEKKNEGKDMLESDNYETREMFKKEFAEYKRVYGEDLTEDDFIKKWDRDIGESGYYRKGDFTHQSITMATNLYNNYLRPANLIGFLYKPFDFHKCTNDLAGWLGDTTNKAFKKPSMDVDDYKADLDAENILHLYNKDKSRDPIEVVNEYYRRIRKGELNRAKMFKEIVDLKYVEDEIRKASPVLENEKKDELLQKSLTLLEVKTRPATMEELKIKNPIGYNFIKSLRNGDNEYTEYDKQEIRNEEQRK